MDKEIVITNFIKNFVLKDRRDRANIELNNSKRRHDFAGRLNHTWDNVLDMRKLKELPKVSDDYNYLKSELRINDNDLCYLISNYSDLDDHFIDFKTAFDKSYGRGFATLIISNNADRLYLETELDYGKQNRFFGKII